MSPNIYLKEKLLSAGVNTVLRAFPWKVGDEILTTTYTYDAVRNTCSRIVQMFSGSSDVIKVL